MVKNLTQAAVEIFIKYIYYLKPAKHFAIIYIPVCILLFLYLFEEYLQ